MRKLFTGSKLFRNASLLIILFSLHSGLQAQLNPFNFVLMSGSDPSGTGTTLIGSSITINGISSSGYKGWVGGYKLVKTTGNVTVNAHNLSGDKVDFTNSNVISGRIAAANSSNSTGTVISVGSSTNISGNIDANGNVVVGGGIVSGTVTIPPDSAGIHYTYSGPTPAGGVVRGPRNIPSLPAMLPETTFPTLPAGAPFNFSSSQTINPGFSYGTITYNGNKTLRLNGPGVYIFDAFQWTGNSNKLIFDFLTPSSTGIFYIYIIGNADFGKLNASIANGNSTKASRIFIETHGDGIGTSVPGNSFIVANGSAGGGSKHFGTVLSRNGIIIGAGTGSSTYTGALYSYKSVTIQSGVSVNYEPFDPCIYPPVDVTDDKPLNFLGQTSLTDSTSDSGATLLWQATNGGIITSPDLTLSTITVSAAGTYILSKTSTSMPTCVSRDTVVVLAAVENKIGAELLSVYLNYGTNSLAGLDSFFVITGDSVMIDVIANQGYYTTLLNLLQTAPYGMRPPYGIPALMTNGESNFIITGNFPIVNLLKINDLIVEVNYARTHYVGDVNSGLKISQGDTSIRSYLVRSGYGINGAGYKIGVISDSYNTITSGTVATTPYQPIKIPPYVPVDPITLDTLGTLNLIPQTFTTNTAALDISNGDLPSVNVLMDFPVRRTDEGRAMLQIIHDVAPGAQLYFRTGLFTAGDFAVGIKELRDAGCDIIVDDVTYITEPFLKDGVVAKTVDTVVGQGVTYISAAGNFADKSYEKDFNPQDITSLGFPGKKAHNFGSGDLFQHVRLAPGSYLFVFQWVDDIYSTGETGGTNNDMDIYLTPNTDGTGLIGFNRDNTDGDPIEFIPITISGTDSVDYNIFIVNNTLASNPSRIKYIVFRGGISIKEYNEGNSTIVGQANALGALAVGAARFNYAPDRYSLNPHPLQPAKFKLPPEFELSAITKPQLENFSSIGGTYVNGSPRQKPDLVGTDGVTTTVKMGQDYPDWALDGFSEFFGTSAAAPHVAGAAALLMEGRKTFITGNPATTSPAIIKSLLQSTAWDMETPGFDLKSGYGLIDVDSAIRTFAAPTPFQIRLDVPENTIPCQDPFVLTIIGQNFSNNSVVYLVEEPGDSTILIPDYISVSKDTILVTINVCTGNPEILVYTPPKTEFDDGGFSNSLFFFDANIVVQSVNIIKQYGQTMPVLDTIITINGVLLQDTTLSLADIGLASLTVETDATTSSDVGTYIIDVNRDFDENNPDDVEFLKKYNYQFIDGTVTIAPLTITITVENVTVNYGDPIPNIEFNYEFDPTGIADPGALLNQIETSHQSQLARDAQGNDILGLVNNKAVVILSGKAYPILSGQEAFIANGKSYTIISGDTIPIVNGKGVTILSGEVTDVNEYNLTSSEIENLSFLATETTLQNTRQITNTSGTTNVIDITQESILDFNKNAAQTQMTNSVSDVNSKGLIDQESYLNGKGVTILSGKAGTILSQKAVTLLSGEEITVFNGKGVTILSGEAVYDSNGVAVPIVSSDSRTAVIVDTTDIGAGTNLIKSLNIISGLDAGDQFILPGDYTDGNFTTIVIPGTLHINKATLQVKADDKTKLYLEDNPPLTVTYSGFVYGQDFESSDVTGEPVVTTTATSTSPVSPPTYPINVGIGTLQSDNYSFNLVPGALTITDECLLTRAPFNNFGSTPTVQGKQLPTTLWVNIEAKVSGQLINPGDYLLFKTGTITLNDIIATDPETNTQITTELIPSGIIIADNTVTAPKTHFDFANNRWTTKVPPGFASTSDIFLTGAVINSKDGFVKKKNNANSNTVVKGYLYSNLDNYSDQWTYGLATYRTPVPYAFDIPSISAEEQIVAINGGVLSYRAGTPLPHLLSLVNGGSGGGGNNYTGSTSSYDNFTACQITTSIVSGRAISESVVQDETQVEAMKTKIKINPNPASNTIRLSYMPLQTGLSKIAIFNLNGKKVMEINNGVWEKDVLYQKNINVSAFPNGVYLIQVINKGTITTEKIVIQR